MGWNHRGTSSFILKLTQDLFSFSWRYLETNNCNDVTAWWSTFVCIHCHTSELILFEHCWNLCFIYDNLQHGLISIYFVVFIHWPPLLSWLVPVHSIWVCTRLHPSGFRIADFNSVYSIHLFTSPTKSTIDFALFLYESVSCTSKKWVWIVSICVHWDIVCIANDQRDEEKLSIILHWIWHPHSVPILSRTFSYNNILADLLYCVQSLLWKTRWRGRNCFWTLKNLNIPQKLFLL